MLDRNHSLRYMLVRLVLGLFFGSILWACANIGNPEGGPYDMTPPRMVEATPANRQINVSDRRIRITFDEYIKLSQQEKVIISPPQIKPAVVSANSKHVDIRLEDSLRPNTTYSIYFDDAIVDNNEDNPIENFSYTFSTGSTIDTMQISGMVLDAETLEPVGGLVVGAYFAEGLTDSTVIQRAFPFASKTNKMGLFTIRGLKDTTYAIYALKDDDSDYKLRTASEGFAYALDRYRTSKRDSLRTDTIKIDSIVRRDTITRDSLVTYPFTYYEPSKIIMRYFVPRNKVMGLERTDRADSLMFTLTFFDEQISAPFLRSLDKPEAKADDLYLTSLRGKSIDYWLRDQELISRDSLRFALEYQRTDSVMNIVTKADTLTLYKPKSRSGAAKPKDARSPLVLSFTGSKGIMSGTLRDSLILTTTLPLERIDSSHISFEAMADSTYRPHPFSLKPDPTDGLRYYIDFDRKYGTKYRVRIDSARLRSIYGHPSDSIVYDQSIQPEAELGHLQISIRGVEHDKAIAQLLSKGGEVLLSSPLKQLDSLKQTDPAEQDSVLSSLLKVSSRANQSQDTAGRSTPATTSPQRDNSIDTSNRQPSISSGSLNVVAPDSSKPDTMDALPADFHRYGIAISDLKPEEYFLRLFIDEDGDGKWSTGEYPNKQPEMMYYSPATYSVKKGFTTSEEWEPKKLSLDAQKPEPLRKTKPEERRQREDKNKEYYRNLESKKHKK